MSTCLLLAHLVSDSETFSEMKLRHFWNGNILTGNLGHRLETAGNDWEDLVMQWGDTADDDNYEHSPLHE